MKKKIEFEIEVLVQDSISDYISVIFKVGGQAITETVQKIFVIDIVDRTTFATFETIFTTHISHRLVAVIKHRLQMLIFLSPEELTKEFIRSSIFVRNLLENKARKEDNYKEFEKLLVTITGD